MGKAGDDRSQRGRGGLERICRVLPGRRGFFRIWLAREGSAEPSSVRAAVIDPFPPKIPRMS